VDAIAGGHQNIEGAQLEVRGLNPVCSPVDEYGVPATTSWWWWPTATGWSDATYRKMVRSFVAGLAAGTRYAKRPRAALERAPTPRRTTEARGTRCPDAAPARPDLARPEAWDAFGRWMEKAQGLLDKPRTAALVARP
jgi:hypothetical protein